MANAVTSLSMVREELFTTIAETEQSLERYLENSTESEHLTSARELLQQLSGTLRLLEFDGAELLVEEVRKLVDQVEQHSTEELTEHFYAVNRGLYVLERYLECVEQSNQSIAEVLLPEINAIRKILKQQPLSEGYFYQGDLTGERLNPAKPLQVKDVDAMARRLRQMYQIGLLGYLRNTEDANLSLMLKALTRLDRVYATSDTDNFYWLAAGALESCDIAKLSSSYERKHMLSRIDRQIRAHSQDLNATTPKALIADLLYTIALANVEGEIVSSVRDVYSIKPLAYAEEDILKLRDQLKGPGLRVFSSLSEVLKEELANAKDELDLIERGTASEAIPQQLLERLHSLEKTFELVGLVVASQKIQDSSPIVAKWVEGATIDRNDLQVVANNFLEIEGIMRGLNRGKSMVKASDKDVFATQQLAEAKIVVTDEARIALAMAQRAITGYLESDGDKLHLAAIPAALESASGGLRFLELSDLASFVDTCVLFIRVKMLGADNMPEEKYLQKLADVLTGIEYMLERGVAATSQDGRSVFEMTSVSANELAAITPVSNEVQH